MLAVSPSSPSRHHNTVTPSASSSSSHSQSAHGTQNTHGSQNPLSLRLYKVLAANFDDESTKEALNTLAELYAPASSSIATSNAASNGAARNGKGKEVVRGNASDIDSDSDWDSDSDEEDDTIQKKLKGNYPFANGASAGTVVVPGDIAARARKNLKRDVETRLAESSRRFLNAFAGVDKQLDTLQEHISAMRVRCDEAQSELRQTNEACRSLLDRAGSLREQRQAIATRQSIVTLFLSRFTLAPEESEAITSRDVPVGPRFFAAMDKAERIREDCRLLMAGEEGPTKAGLDIMSTTSSYLEQAYEKMFRWLSFEFRQMGREALLEVSPVMRESVKRLKQRPELLTEALSYLSQTRQTALLTSFTDALTRGGPGGLPRPIELHAHDPLRYVGDMLAWVHQAIAAEREFLEGLFGVGGNSRRMVGAVRTFEKSEEEEWMGELMDASVGKLCLPLKGRVQQTVRSQESSITLFKIANLLQFYSLTMQRTIGEEAELSKALKDMTVMSYQIFFAVIETQGRSLLRISLDLDDPSLSPPFPILDHVQVLREIMQVYQSSIIEDPSPSSVTSNTLSPPTQPPSAESEAEEIEAQLRRESHEAGFREIVDKMIDPAIEMVVSASEEKSRVRKGWDKQVFVVNTLTYLQDALEPYAFTAEKQGVLQGLIEARVMQLTEEHFASILKDTGLGEIIDAWKTRKGNEPLSHLPLSSPSKLQSALHKFSLWLTTHAIDQSPRLAHLTKQSLASRIHQAALERLVKTYKWFCEEVKKPENRYEAAATLLGSERPFGQVHLLWQIFGIEEKEV
ncbi:oligomeric complex COG6 [Panus rudis PR-1116 ss-1]|nr:oligomeric complex COG6 [Panus rudis PR-1116 ss-1]